MNSVSDMGSGLANLLCYVNIDYMNHKAILRYRLIAPEGNDGGPEQQPEGRSTSSIS